MKFIWEKDDLIGGVWAGRVVKEKAEIVAIAILPLENEKRIGLCPIMGNGVLFFPEDTAAYLSENGFAPYDRRRHAPLWPPVN